MSVFEFLLDFTKAQGYPGALIAGFLGSLTNFYPSYVIIALLGSQLNPAIVGLLGGIGAGLGQFLYYYMGKGSRFLLTKSMQSRLDKWSSRLGRYGFWLIFVFAATPLTPDILIWVPIGAMGYDKRKALMSVIAGKTILNLGYAYAGFYGLPIIEQLLHL